MKITSSKLGDTSPHYGTSPLDKNTMSSTMSSPTLSVNNFPTTLHLECLGNASPSTISHASASTSAWTAQHNDSLGKSRPPTLTMQTWKNCSITWSGTYVQKVSSTHSMKAMASQSPIPLSTNRGPRSSGPYLANGNNKVNVLGQQPWPSTYASMKKPPHSTCSYSKMTGSPPQLFTTCRRDSISLNLKTPSGGKYSGKTTLYTTRSSISKDTCTWMTDLMLDTWKHPPKKGINVASWHHFSILSLSLNLHHLTNYLNYHLTHAPDWVPHDWRACDHSHDPVTNHLILTLDSSCDQACDLSRDTMWLSCTWPVRCQTQWLFSDIWLSLPYSA